MNWSKRYGQNVPRRTIGTVKPQRGFLVAHHIKLCGHGFPLLQEIDDLKKQNEELLEALENLYNDLSNNRYSVQNMNVAKELIKSTKG